MRRAAGAVAFLTVGAVTLTACATAPPSPPATGTGATTSAPAVLTPTPSPSTTAVPALRHDLIKDIPFSNVTWYDVIAEKDVPLTNGTNTQGDRTWNQQGHLAYADANGDGELDALVQIDVVRNHKTRSFLYLWVWDKAKGTAIQHRDPVGFYDACGTELDSVRPSLFNGFDIDERYHDMAEPCEQKAAHKLTRTVVLSNGGLMMVAPVQAYGGVCYPSQAEGSRFPMKKIIRTLPSPNGTVVTSSEQVFFELPYTNERTWPNGWRQVSWIDDNIKNNKWFWGVCGFTYIL